MSDNIRSSFELDASAALAALRELDQAVSQLQSALSQSSEFELGDDAEAAAEALDEVNDTLDDVASGAEDAAAGVDGIAESGDSAAGSAEDIAAALDDAEAAAQEAAESMAGVAGATGGASEQSGGLSDNFSLAALSLDGLLETAKGLAPAFAAGAAAAAGLVFVGEQVAEAQQSIAFATRASGERLTELAEIAAAASTDSFAGLSESADQVGILNTRLGELPDAPLQELVADVGDLSAVSGDSADAISQGLARSIRRFNLDADDAREILGDMFVVTANTDIGITDLADTVVKAASAFGSANIGFEEILVLLGRLETGGFQATRIIRGLSSQLAIAIQEGSTPAEFMAGFVDAAQSAESLEEAAQAVVEFGLTGENALQLADAAQQGLFDGLEEGAAALGDNEETISDLADETITATQELANLKDLIIEELAPLAIAALQPLIGLIETVSDIPDVIRDVQGHFPSFDLPTIGFGDVELFDLPAFNTGIGIAEENAQAARSAAREAERAVKDLAVEAVTAAGEVGDTLSQVEFDALGEALEAGDFDLEVPEDVERFVDEFVGLRDRLEDEAVLERLANSWGVELSRVEEIVTQFDIDPTDIDLTPTGSGLDVDFAAQLFGRRDPAEPNAQFFDSDEFLQLRDSDLFGIGELLFSDDVQEKADDLREALGEISDEAAEASERGAAITQSIIDQIPTAESALSELQGQLSEVGQDPIADLTFEGLTSTQGTQLAETEELLDNLETIEGFEGGEAIVDVVLQLPEDAQEQIAGQVAGLIDEGDVEAVTEFVDIVGGLEAQREELEQRATDLGEAASTAFAEGLAEEVDLDTLVEDLESTPGGRLLAEKITEDFAENVDLAGEGEAEVEDLNAELGEVDDEIEIDVSVESPPELTRIDLLLQRLGLGVTVPLDFAPSGGIPGARHGGLAGPGYGGPQIGLWGEGPVPEAYIPADAPTSVKLSLIEGIGATAELSAALGSRGSSTASLETELRAMRSTMEAMAVRFDDLADDRGIQRVRLVGGGR